MLFPPSSGISLALSTCQQMMGEDWLMPLEMIIKTFSLWVMALFCSILTWAHMHTKSRIPQMLLLLFMDLQWAHIVTVCHHCRLAILTTLIVLLYHHGLSDSRFPPLTLFIDNKEVVTRGSTLNPAFMNVKGYLAHDFWSMTCSFHSTMQFDNFN